MYNLNGQAAVVTGAGSGLGQAIARRLSLEGAAVVAADLNRRAAENLAAELKGLGRRGLALEADVTVKEDAERMVKQCLENFGQLDILVNNAGAGSLGLIVNQTEEEWERPMRVNLRGTFLCSQVAAKEMIPRKKGRIINISSISGKSGEEFIGPYCASKFGVIGLTQALAKELARFSVNVNAVCPGYIWTPMWAEMAKWLKESVPALAGKTPQEIFESRVKSVTPLRRPQTAEDIANLVAFLVSDQASNITGQAINVDGGAVMH